MTIPQGRKLSSASHFRQKPNVLLFTKEDISPLLVRIRYQARIHVILVLGTRVQIELLIGAATVDR
jgi:hypothetical protein